MRNYALRIGAIVTVSARIVWPLAVVLVVCAFIMAGCHDTPVKPKPTTEVLYFGAWHGSADPQEYRIYTFDATTLSLLDSLIVDELPLEMEVSTDGESLYYVTVSGPLHKVHARTGALAWTKSGYYGPRLLNDGRMLVGAGSPGFQQSAVLDQSTGETVQLLPDSLDLGYGPEDGTELAAIVDNEGTTLDSVVTVLDAATGRTRGRFVPYVGGAPLRNLYYARLHGDGVRVLVLGVRFTLQDSWFAIGNVETGETLFTFRLIYPFGEIRISPDGSLAAVTDPSRALIYDSYPTLDLFSLDSYSHLRHFDFFSDSLVSVLGQVRFQSDHEFLVVAPEAGLGSGPMYQIDFLTLDVVNSALQPGCDADGLNCPFVGGIALGVR